MHYLHKKVTQRRKRHEASQTKTEATEKKTKENIIERKVAQNIDKTISRQSKTFRIIIIDETCEIMK